MNKKDLKEVEKEIAFLEYLVEYIEELNKEDENEINRAIRWGQYAQAKQELIFLNKLKSKESE